jgi:hypothetical protein
MIFSGCSICQRPDVDAINAALRSQSVRAVAAAFPGLSKSTLGRHAKHADEPEAVLHPVSNLEAENQAPRVRHRTRPAALSCAPGAPGAAPIVTDPEKRALQALWRRQAGQSPRQIAAAFNVPESTITADLARLRAKEIEEARQTAAEEYYADFRASQRLLVARLIAIHDRATAKGDERAALDALKELRQLTRQDVDVLRDLGAFQAFKVTSLREREEADDEMSLPRVAKNFMRAIAEMYDKDDEPLEIDLEAISRRTEAERAAADPADPDLS